MLSDIPYHFWFFTKKTTTEDSGKLTIDQNEIAKFWKYANVPNHPGSLAKTNVVGLYGDDCKYNAVGEKLIVVAFNVVLFEHKSHR